MNSLERFVVRKALLAGINFIFIFGSGVVVEIKVTSFFLFDGGGGICDVGRVFGFCGESGGGRFGCTGQRLSTCSKCGNEGVEVFLGEVTLVELVQTK